jgi:hypothetical protein
MRAQRSWVAFCFFALIIFPAPPCPLIELTVSTHHISSFAVACSQERNAKAKVSILPHSPYRHTPTSPLRFGCLAGAHAPQPHRPHDLRIPHTHIVRVHQTSPTAVQPKLLLLSLPRRSASPAPVPPTPLHTHLPVCMHSALPRALARSQERKAKAKVSISPSFHSPTLCSPSCALTLNSFSSRSVAGAQGQGQGGREEGGALSPGREQGHGGAER